MKIKYLGTAAAEGIPAPFCHCGVCEYARKMRGREIRTRMQAVVDDRILLDFGPDTYMHTLEHNIDLSAFEVCFITHSHSDHLFVHDILMRKENHALYHEEIHPLYIYGGAGARESFNLKEHDYITKDGRVIFKNAVAYQPIHYKNYSITPLPACHKTKDPLIYLIESGEKSLLYAHDTDYFREDVWQYLLNRNVPLNLVSLDCTEGAKHIDYHGHMNFERDALVRKRMLDLKIADEHTQFVASHFSHNGLITYRQAVESTFDFLIAYDGMEIEV